MSGGSPARSTAVLTIATAGAGAAVAWLRPDLALTEPASVEAALGQGAAVVASACVAWLWLVTALTVLEAVARTPRARLGCPATVRRLVLVACGVALAGGMAPLTHASEGADSPGSDSSSGLVVGLPVPDRTAVVAPTAASPAAPFRVSARRVVVAPGDSLWSIAARRLPPEAPSDAVEALWREIYAANAAAIGPDPDLIRPGMRLQVPGVAR